MPPWRPSVPNQGLLISLSSHSIPYRAHNSVTAKAHCAPVAAPKNKIEAYDLLNRGEKQHRWKPDVNRQFPLATRVA